MYHWCEFGDPPSKLCVQHNFWRRLQRWRLPTPSMELVMPMSCSRYADKTKNSPKFCISYDKKGNKSSMILQCFRLIVARLIVRYSRMIWVKLSVKRHSPCCFPPLPRLLSSAAPFPTFLACRPPLLLHLKVVLRCE